MTTVLSPLLLVVLVLIPPLTEAQGIPGPCEAGYLCPPETPICYYGDGCFCNTNTYGDDCTIPCGGALLATTGGAVLTSPNYPADYPTFMLCNWNITAPPGFQVMVTFNDFELEKWDQCYFDVVFINDAYYCDDKAIPPPTTAPFIQVNFRSEYSGTYRGFNLTYQAVGIDECESYPCQNGGTCQDGANSFTCVCAPGFSGTLCEAVEMDECEPNPCQNGGTCQDGDISFTCVCAPGFSGMLCEAVEIDECESNPCQNGGTCQDGANSFTCVCAPGFSGTLCEAVEMDECEPNPCQNGGTCQDGANSFTCVCAPGFSGTLCEATVYTLTYCIARGGRGLALGAPPAVTLTLTGSAGSTEPVTLTRGTEKELCSRVTLTSTSIGDIQKAMVRATNVRGNQKTTLWNLAVSGAGQSCSFPDTEFQGEETRTLAASC